MENTDRRMNLNFISEKLLEEFNNNKEPSDNFSSRIVGLDESDETYEPEKKVIISNNGVDCYSLKQPTFDEFDRKYVILGGLNTKCSNSKGSGTKNLLNVIRFGKKYNYDIFDLYNIAGIQFILGNDLVEVNLTFLKLLINGNSWYSQFGFESDFSREYQNDFKEYINMTFEEFIEKYNEFIDTDRDKFMEYFASKSPEEKMEMKEQFREDITKYIELLKLCNSNPIQSIESTKIKDYFNNLQTCIYHMRKELEMNNIDVPMFKSIIKSINEFIAYMLANIVRVGINYGIGYDNFKNNLINSPNNNKRILKIIKENYSNLLLDFKKAKIIGGKKKRRTNNRKTNKKNQKRKINRKTNKKILK